MISDSPYQVRFPVLESRVGMAAGLAGAFAMLALTAMFQPISALRAADLLAQIGRAVLPASVGRSLLMLTGVAVHTLLGALFGLLYAVCQQRVPLRGLIAVGLFYGFVLWVVASVIIGSLFDPALRYAICRWPWLLSHLLYGLCLAGVAAWSHISRRAGMEMIVPKD
jgi:hypothetical protein